MAAHASNEPYRKPPGRIRLIRVPLCRQETEYTCGVACVQSFLRCYGFDFRQDLLAQRLHTKPFTGTDYRNILRLMNDLGFEARLYENMDPNDLKRLIDAGITPLLLIQAWKKNGVDYATDWGDGHYVIACGHMGDLILIMDPFTLGNYTYLHGRELMKRWHVKEPCGRAYYGAGLVIQKGCHTFQYDPYDIEHLG